MCVVCYRGRPMAEVSVASPSVAPPATSTPPTSLSTVSPREQIRIEFYKTYDVMTGVRIAATLGGFFGLMVLLVVYKSKCKSRSLSDEHLEAAVAAAAIEEEEQLALNALNLYGPRRSLGNMSAPIGRPFPRFSSLGGHNMLNTPMRLCNYGQRARVSVPVVEHKMPAFVPSPRLTLTSPPLKRPYPEEEEEEEEDDDYPVNFLQVPSRRASRRLSSITCSSADTSYLERRGSAVEVGHPPPPPLRRPPLPSDSWDFYYPIDIQVIQPTPLLSPCASDGTLYDHPRVSSPPLSVGLSPLLLPSSPHRLAPLASISSCQVSSVSAPEAAVSDCHSLGSDSVFLDEECMDTEDEAEEFSTDSDVQEYAETKRQFDKYNPSSVPFAEHLQMSNYPKTLAGRFHGVTPIRRYSTPSSRDKGKSRERGGSYGDDVSCRPQLPLPHEASSSDTLEKTTTTTENITLQEARPRPSTSLSCDHLVRVLTEHSRLQTSSVRDLTSWSQETLF
ncbi:uncharacterized protein LOC128986461 isoform X2 [Macrosteles quadrilineatus]|uniref:uncharacterized protein LOC128986461 isoform X2 n=1 Tax=Macrosteles quadrilineatus TaxID=74068 RepID=UPI0023E318AB|nr:uncharacterized protein LOC128986461 isoform X2 [Macrosteles quadrilineatus]